MFDKTNSNQSYLTVGGISQLRVELEKKYDELKVSQNDILKKLDEIINKLKKKVA
jgi:hypothetical protein